MAQRRNDKRKPEGSSKPQNKRRFSAQKTSDKKTTKPVKKANANPNEIRLNKYISNSGICSRRDADQYIAMGLVTVNGKIIN